MLCLCWMNNSFRYLFGQIQTCQTGGQLYSNTAPYGECFLVGQTSLGETTLGWNEMYYENGLAFSSRYSYYSLLLW